MGCGCGGSKKTASQRLAARRAARTASAGSRVGGVTDDRTFWNGPKKAAKPQT
jgi:hypothetical protein